MGDAKRRAQQHFEKTPPEGRLGDAPIEEQYHNKMVAVAQSLDTLFNGNEPDRKTGFVLMVFPFGDAAGGRCNYISNGSDRNEVVVLMKEMIARFESHYHEGGTA
jgi:hypothetical protein